MVLQMTILSSIELALRFKRVLELNLLRDSPPISAGGVLNYAFLASGLQSAGLQNKLLHHVAVTTSRHAFDDALYAFNTKVGTDIMSNPSEITAPPTHEEIGRHIFCADYERCRNYLFLLTASDGLVEFSTWRPCY